MTDKLFVHVIDISQISSIEEVILKNISLPFEIKDNKIYIITKNGYIPYKEILKVWFKFKISPVYAGELYDDGTYSDNIYAIEHEELLSKKQKEVL